MKQAEVTPRADETALLRFPAELVKLRRSRNLSQKALALTLRMDQSQLSGLERGTRPPPSQGTLDSIGTALSLGSSEQRQLEWSARHDRCILLVADAAASTQETALVSQVLSAALLMNSRQMEGLSEYLRSLQLAAAQMNVLTERVN